MRVVWTPEAQQDRADVWEYIAADNPRAAAQLDELFSDAAARLAQHPLLGRPDLAQDLLAVRDLNAKLAIRRVALPDISAYARVIIPEVVVNYSALRLLRLNFLISPARSVS